MKRFFSLAAALYLSASLNASPADALADGYQDMYNLRFDSAHKAFKNYELSEPADPMGPVSDAAAYLFFELERLKILRSEFFADNKSFFAMKQRQPDLQVKRDFEAALARSKVRSDALLKKQPEAKEAMLADVLRVALHSNYLAMIEKNNWQALTEIKQARIQADALVKKYPDCFDAYLAMGVENYLLSQKMAPMRLFLRMTGAQTDKQEGLSKLRLVAEKGHYLKPYAKILLAIAALRDEKPGEAVGLLKQLSVQFPTNDLFEDELKKLCEQSLPACSNT